MTMISADFPLLLLLLPILLAAFWFSAFQPAWIPSLEAAPSDKLSGFIEIGLSCLAAVALSAPILALSGAHIAHGQITKIAEGAELALLIDRSGSMNETFAGRQPSGEEESKAAAAKRILTQFLRERHHDLTGVAAFSTSPILVMPPTSHHSAIEAAIRAIDRPGLDYTNIGRGLAMALSMFQPESAGRSRAILLVSDGAARIDPRVQEKLRASFQQLKVSLYWLFLRTAGSKGISDQPGPGEDTPQSMPERHLDIFFKTLGVPYRAFESEGPAAVEDAITRINRLERQPVEIREVLPRTDLSSFFVQTALFASVVLLAAKLCETPEFRCRSLGRVTSPHFRGRAA
ncbi:MAG TPA: vWA domain-containing protein [Methylocella sp.]|nr:vWA domain-containing protein [Methylocella sp.]